MVGVVVWAYKHSGIMWNPYEPDVSCELERLYSMDNQQNVNLGAISPSLSSYQVSFAQMKQITLSSGSMRDIKRCICPTSALAKGVVWEFLGDSPTQWTKYDLESMDVIEDGYVKSKHIGTTLLDLQHSVRQLPYVIDFGKMTQMRVETGRIRKIQRRQLSQPYTPLIPQTFGAITPGLPSSSMFPGSLSQDSWQQQQATVKHQATRSRQRHQPYTFKSGAAPALGISLNGFNGLSTHVPQQVLQQSLLNQGPVRRSQVQQTTGNNSAVAAPPQHAQIQLSSGQHMFQGAQQQFYQQTLQNLHNSGSYFLSHTTGFPPGIQFPPSTSLGQPSMNVVAPVLTHQQVSRPSSTSSMSSSSSSSSMSVSGSQGCESLPSLSKISIGKSKKTNCKTGHVVLDSYMKSINTDLDKNDCSICFDKLSEASSYGEGRPDAHEAVELNKCGHQFHKLCLLEMYNSIHKDSSLQCPSCKTIYGEKSGICPPGYMQWRAVQNLPLPGYESYGTLIVSYHISAGVQGPEHPNPGHRFSARGFPRYGYLPDCDKGRKVLKLLMEAFKRRLMFTIATSNTTGEENTVTWNEIHHKTEPHGNSSGHGYPDPQYLDNVLMELAAHGVTEECLR